MATTTPAPAPGGTVATTAAPPVDPSPSAATAPSSTTRPAVEVRAAALRRTGDATGGSGVTTTELAILGGFAALVVLGAFLRRARPPIV